MRDDYEPQALATQALATQALAAYVAIHGRGEADSAGAEAAVAAAIGRPALPALAEAIRQLNL